MRTRSVLGHSRSTWLCSGAAVVFAAVSGSLVIAGPADTSGVSADDPDYLQLTGVVRDFHEESHRNGHPDFEVVPSRGFGHYVGNIATRLGDDGKPEFIGGGFKVDDQWTDKTGKPITCTRCTTAAGAMSQAVPLARPTAAFAMRSHSASGSVTCPV